MYLEYWGFHKFPFENVPDPDFFYLSKTHKEGLFRLTYAAKMRKGGAMLSGDIGCGKTTLTKVYLQKLSTDQFNNLCDLSLLIGFSKNGKMIGPQIIEDIMSDGALF